MESFLIYKDFILPLLSACIGTAAGAMGAQVWAEEKLKYNSLSEEIINSNNLLAETFLQINSLFSCYEMYYSQMRDFEENKIIAIDLINEKTQRTPHIRLEKIFLDSINPSEIKVLSSSAKSNFKVLSAASKISVCINEINRFQKEINNEIDDIYKNIKNQKIALSYYFGLEINGITRDKFRSTLENLITQLKFSILLASEIIEETQRDKQKIIKNYETFTTTKLPKLLNIYIDEIKNDKIYPVKKDFSYFLSIS